MTVDVSVVRPRTAAATAARQRSAAQKAAVRLGVEQLEHLDDEYLVRLTSALHGEIERRGLVVPWEFPRVDRKVKTDG